MSPFQYTQMIRATLLGFPVCNDLPAPAVVVGALMVAASGLFILYRETTLGRRPTASLHTSATAANGGAEASTV